MKTNFNIIDPCDPGIWPNRDLLLKQTTPVKTEVSVMRTSPIHSVKYKISGISCSYDIGPKHILLYCPVTLPLDFLVIKKEGVFSCQNEVRDEWFMRCKAKMILHLWPWPRTHWIQIILVFYRGRSISLSSSKAVQWLDVRNIFF